MAITIAALTVLATAIGGLLALRARDHLHLVLGLSAGLLLGLVSFDLIPEVFELSSSELGHVPTVMVLFVSGFLALHIIERASGAHEPVGSEYGDGHDHQHSHTAGVIGALGMATHVFLDGVAVGLAFQVSTALGTAVAIAVVAHAFTDGLNTVAMLVHTENWRKTSLTLLGVDATARISGAALGSYLVISDGFLGSYLALFAGLVTYLATSHILPEAHSSHPSRLTLFATIFGVAIMFVIVNVAHG